MAQTAPRKKASATQANAARSRDDRLLPALRVVYWKRMRSQRVYRVTVGWQRSRIRPPSGAEPIRLRLIMAGAQVVPAEQTLDPNNPDATATFYVTPLVNGKLAAERLEVLLQGRKVQELPLPAKVVNQRRTWVLLALMLLVPWFVYAFLRPAEMAHVEPLTEADFHLPGYITDNLPALPAMLTQLSASITEAWRELHRLTQAHPLEAYVLLGFLLLALLSWLNRTSRRKRRVGKPIPLPRSAE